MMTAHESNVAARAPRGREAETLNAMFHATARRLPDSPALEHKAGGQWRPVTYAELSDRVYLLASCLFRVGIRARSRA